MLARLGKDFTKSTVMHSGCELVAMKEKRFQTRSKFIFKVLVTEQSGDSNGVSNHE